VKLRGAREPRKNQPLLAEYVVSRENQVNDQNVLPGPASGILRSGLKEWSRTGHHGRLVSTLVVAK
jgi:hypothetical protein